jgi:hypothetical protein
MKTNQQAEQQVQSHHMQGEKTAQGDVADHRPAAKRTHPGRR